MNPPQSSPHHYNKIPDSLSVNALQSFCVDPEQLVDIKKDGIIAVGTEVGKVP